MRFAIVYDVIYPFTKGGGEKIVYEVTRRFGDEHEVHLFSLKLWPGDDTLQLAPNVWAHGVCGVPQKSNAERDEFHVLSQVLRFSASLPMVLWKHGPFDVIDCYSIPYLPLLSAKAVCLVTNTPLVSTWLEVWPRDVWRNKFGYFGGTIGDIVQKLFAYLPRKLIAISEHTRKGLLDLRIPAHRIGLITPGVDWHRIHTTPPAAKTTDLLYVGRLIKDKGVDLLIDAVAKLKAGCPSIHCTIVGDGPERLALQNQAAALGLIEHIEFLGVVQDAYPHFKAAKILVHPSRREGFGITLVEAAAAGIPVITVDLPTNAACDLVREGKFGVLCDASPESLAQAMLNLLNNDAQRQVFGENGSTWSQGYDWAVIANLTEIVYSAESKKGAEHEYSKLKNPK